MPKKDDFGNRMKAYEAIESARRFIPLLPVYARIDGKCFSSFTRGFERPYDMKLTDAMIRVTAFLIEETNAKIGYTQSDEINLIWEQKNYDSEIFFNGKIQKMVSVLASLATAKFNSYDWTELAFFDCRIFQLPNRTEAANAILWREKDATKNAVSMAARSVYSHKQLFKKSDSDMQEMLFQKGINFNDYPSFFKRGTFLRRITEERLLTEDELAKIPEQYRPADCMATRSRVAKVEMPIFTKVINREAVIFEGAEPICEQPKQPAGAKE